VDRGEEVTEKVETGTVVVVLPAAESEEAMEKAEEDLEMVEAEGVR